jgi:tetratricopeptide (TPR) repeat protein
VAAYQNAITLHPDFHWSHYKLGESLEALGRWQEAVDAYKKAVKYKPDLYWAYQKLGETLNKLDCWEEAIRCFRKAIDFNPKVVEPNPVLYWAYQKLGETLHHLWRFDEAVTAFRQAIAVNPTAKWSYFHLAEVLTQQEEWSEAIASYQKAIALDLTEPQVFWGLGKALEALKRWDEAIATYDKTIELNPNLPESYHHLGNLLLRRRQWTEAVAAHEKAVKLSPKFSAYREGLGRALYYLGKSLAEQDQWSEAVEKYRQALYWGQSIYWGFNKGPVHYHLGKGLSQLGCYEEAVVELKQALEFNPLFLLWEKELEYAMNQLGRTLVTESKESRATWKTQLSTQPDIKDLNQLLTESFIEYPKSNQDYYQVIRIGGWILPKNSDVGSVKIIAKSAEYEREESLSFERPDVITKILNSEPEKHPQLFCGFGFEVEVADRIELYISIEGKRYHWKTIEATVQKTAIPSYEMIVKSQQVWRNYITNNLNDISKSDAEALASLDPEAVKKHIYGEPELVRKYNFKLAINYLDLSDSDRSNLEKFLNFTSSPQFCANLVESALNKGFCQIPNPFGEGYAVCKESYYNVKHRVTLLRFVTHSGETFIVVQHTSSADAIYFPVINLLFFLNSCITPTVVNEIIIDWISQLRKNFSYTIKREVNKLGGIISSIYRPAHYYYEICWGLYNLHQKLLLTQVPSVYTYRGGNFFLISSLFSFDQNREVVIENLQFISDKSIAKNEFYIHIGSNGYGSNDRPNKEKLSEMIVSTAAELVDDATGQEVQQARECYPLLWLGVTSQSLKRAWVEQVEGWAKIIAELAKIYPNIGVVFDGWTAPLNPSPDDINEAARDHAVVDGIVQLLPSSVKTFTVIGSTTVRKLAFATVIDVFIAQGQTGSTHVDWFAKKPGVLHDNNYNRLGAARHCLRYNAVTVPSNQVVDIPNTGPTGENNYSINPDVILNLVKEILTQSNL